MDEWQNDFDRNKLNAELTCLREKERIPKSMRLIARSNYLEIGVTFPREARKSNLFTDVEYKLSSSEFVQKANDACEYFYRIGKQIDSNYPVIKFDNPSKCEKLAKMCSDGKVRCPCKFLIGEAEQKPLTDLPWWVKI